MECSTSRVEYNWGLRELMLGEFVFDLSGLYAHLERLTDGRDPRGVRYQLVDALTLIILAKLGGEDEARGIADWLKHIENHLHYRRDVSLKEDRCRLRTGQAARTMAILNNLVLALIDRLDFQTVPDARRKFSAKPLEALKLLFQQPSPTLQ